MRRSTARGGFSLAWGGRGRAGAVAWLRAEARPPGSSQVRPLGLAWACGHHRRGREDGARTTGVVFVSALVLMTQQEIKQKNLNLSTKLGLS